MYGTKNNFTKRPFLKCLPYAIQNLQKCSFRFVLAFYTATGSIPLCRNVWAEETEAF